MALLDGGTSVKVPLVFFGGCPVLDVLLAAIHFACPALLTFVPEPASRFLKALNDGSRVGRFTLYHLKSHLTSHMRDLGVRVSG